MVLRSIYRTVVFTLGLGVAAVLAVSCELDEELEKERDNIRTDLRNQKIYERGNLPGNTPVEDIKGYFDIIDGAFRYIVNEQRENRSQSPQIHAGDRISFYFDARVYKGNYANSPTFYTNLVSRMQSVNGEPYWSTDPLIITLGDDPLILKHVQTALIGCRADNGDTSDDEDGGIESDVVRIFLPYDIGFGNRWVYNVPPRSTLLFEISNIEII